MNGKYKVLAKIGVGHRSNVYSISSQKGQKQLVRAIKVVRPILSRKAIKLKNLKSEHKFPFLKPSKIQILTKLASHLCTSLEKKKTTTT